MILVRLILIFLIVYLLVKGFIRSLYFEDPPIQDRESRNRYKDKEEKPKRVSKSIGEYIDYEESNKKDSGRS